MNRNSAAEEPCATNTSSLDDNLLLALIDDLNKSYCLDLLANHEYMRAVLENGRPWQRLRAAWTVEAERERDAARAEVERLRTTRPTPVGVLVAHQRHGDGCLCGWHVLGASHCQHQIEALAAAGYAIVNGGTGD